MRAIEIKKAMDSDAALNEFEERAYLGISSLSRCPRELVQWLGGGRRRPGLKGRRLCHEGYLHEADVIRRLEAGGVAVRDQGREVVYDRDHRLLGHVDGIIGDRVLEIKSVTTKKYDQVVKEGPFSEHIIQTQLYMRLLGYKRGVIIYKDRQYGALWVCDVWPNGVVEDLMIKKAMMVLRAFDEGWLPDCECGRCK